MNQIIVMAMCVGILALPDAAIAQKVMVLGFGANTCGAFVSTTANSVDETMYVVWLTGFVSGVNAWKSAPADILKDTDVGALKVWLQNYCRTNPLEMVMVGANQLVRELITRQEPARK